MKKKFWVVLVLVLMAGNLAGCANRTQSTAVNNSLSGTIKISTTSSSRFLEEAAYKFEKRHPGVQVKIEAHLTPELLQQNNPGEVMDNYINTLNTELMSGKGADIIYVNALPYKKYIDRHMFADLKQLMKSDPDYDAQKYYANLFAAVEVNGGLYTLPIEYGYELLGCESKLEVDDRAWSWQNFFSMAPKAAGSQPSGRYILPYVAEDLCGIIVRQNFSHFVNEAKQTASLDSQEFISLLEQCKRLADAGQLAKSQQDISAQASEQALFQYHVIESVYHLASQPSNLYRLPSYDKGRHGFVTTMFAINNVSPNKAAAWEFLKFLISDEIQTSPSLLFPVNKSAFKARCAMETKQFYENEAVNLSRDKKASLMNKYAAFNESLVKEFNTCWYIDHQIMEIIEAELHPFFAGKASAEDVARIIQKKVNIYLKE